MGKKRPVTAGAVPHPLSKKAKSKGSNSGAGNGQPRQLRDCIGGDAAVTALLCSWEESEPCYIESHITSFPPLPKSSDIVEIAEGSGFSLGREVFVTTWDGDEPQFGTNEGLAGKAALNRYFQDGWSLSYFNLDRHEPRVKQLRTMLDGFWQGKGGCDIMVQATPADHVPFAPAMHSSDLFIFQVEGVQSVTLYELDEESMAQGTMCSDLGLHFCTVFPELLDADNDISPALAVELKPGDFLYVPQNLAIFTHTQDLGETSTAAWAFMPEQVAWDDVMAVAMETVQEQMELANGMRFFPRRTQAGDGAMAEITDTPSDEEGVLRNLLQDMLQAASQSVGVTLKAMCTEAAKYTRDDFDPKDVKSMDLERLIDDNGGLVKVRGVLPDEMADKLCHLLHGLADEDWALTQEDQGNTQYAAAVPHAFMSSRRFPNSHAVLDLFRGIMPGKQAVFSAGMYTASGSHFIDSHDDRAYKEIAGQVYSRDIAFIYYLTKDWAPEDGGQLVDFAAGGKEYLPEFNTAVAFKVPRYHAVKPPTGDRPRLSVFGWFFEQGQTYDLDYTGHELDPQSQSDAPQKQHILSSQKNRNGQSQPASEKALANGHPRKTPHQQHAGSRKSKKGRGFVVESME